MSNNLYNNGFFNEEQKRRFLDNDETGEDTKVTYGRIFLRSYSLENSLNKDLYNFNLPEIERLLIYLDPLSVAVSRTNGFVVRSYIEWAISEGLRENNINPLSTFTGDDFYKKFVDRTKKTIFSKEEVDDVVDQLRNKQDAATVQLVFEGAFGEGLEELTNLKKDDVRWGKNLLLLTDKDGSKRKHEVSEKCIKLLGEAADEKIYLKNNGDSDSRSKEVFLMENNYIFRKAERVYREDSDKGDYYLVSRRFNMIKKVFNEPYFTPKRVRNSGMLYLAKRLYERDGVFERPQIIEVCEKYNVGLTKGNEYNYYSYISDFLNIDKIKEMYGDSS